MLCYFVLKFLANWNYDLDSHKGFCSSWKSFQKPLLNNSPPSRLRPYILTRNAWEVTLRISCLEIIPNFYNFVHPDEALMNRDKNIVDQPRDHHVVAWFHAEKMGSVFAGCVAVPSTNSSLSLSLNTVSIDQHRRDKRSSWILAWMEIQITWSWFLLFLLHVERKICPKETKEGVR